MKTIFAFTNALLSLTSSIYAIGQINIAYTPFTINTPGSYIVVKDLTTAQNHDCIDINTSNVTIDLNGHTLYGAGSTTGSGGYGIYDTFFGANNVTIFNGTIRDFRDEGVRLNGDNARVERINVYGNSSYGIEINPNNGGALVADCNVSFNGNYGIVCYHGEVRNNRVTSNNGDGIFGSDLTVIQNDVYKNQTNGIEVDNSLIENNHAEYNKLNGIAGSGSRIVNNFSKYNGSNSGLGGKGAGINASSNNNIENNTLYSNDTGILATFSSNYIAGNRLSNNTVSISTAGGNTLGNGSTGFFNINY